MGGLTSPDWDGLVDAFIKLWTHLGWGRGGAILIICAVLGWKFIDVWGKKAK